MSALKGISSETTALIGTILVIVVSTLLFLRQRQKQKQKQQAAVLDLKDLLLETNEIEWDDGKSKGMATQLPKKATKIDREDDGEPQLKNVFDVKQLPQNVGNHAKGGSKGELEKPFKSSYYYAHNQHRKTGGYSDGLRAEDYVMNGPKLLNKGSEHEVSTILDQAATTRPVKGNSISINRYLWDDDGSKAGVAKIYIDTLPGKGSGTFISWKDQKITKNDIVSKLVGVGKIGLIVQIRSLDTRYHLYIPRMYGEVEEVKTVVKSSKLIVKLTKKKQKENTKAWPQLPSKVVKSATDGVDYVNEDLFLQ